MKVRGGTLSVMWRVYGGAILVLAGIAAFIEAHRHIPIPARPPAGVGLVTPASGLSPTAYDLLRLGGWALVILGSVTVAVGLIRYAVRYAAAKPLGAVEMSANGASGPDRPPLASQALSPAGVEASHPWDEGPHGEAVQPNPER